VRVHSFSDSTKEEKKKDSNKDGLLLAGHIKFVIRATLCFKKPVPLTLLNLPH